MHAAHDIGFTPVNGSIQSFIDLQVCRGCRKFTWLRFHVHWA